ncbi:hypothetical protein HDU80_007513 [Chytriomyces hyalinus]|nr:hypothetical protein HDU80_007513 [Chytriomyces hyalinus]
MTSLQLAYSKASMEYIPGTAVADRSLASESLNDHFESGHVAAAAEQASFGVSDEYASQRREDDESVASTLLSLNPKIRPSLESSEEPPAKRVAFSSITSSPKPSRTPQLLSINTPTLTSSSLLNPQSWFTTPQPTPMYTHYPNPGQAYFQHPGLPQFNNPAAMQMMPFYMPPQQTHPSLQRINPVHLQASIPAYHHPQQPMYWAPHAMQYPHRFPQVPPQTAPMMLVHPRGHFKRTSNTLPTSIQKQQQQQQQQQLQQQQRAPKSAVATHPSKTPADMPVLGLGIIRDGVSCVVRPSTSTSSTAATSSYSASEACSSMQQTADSEIGEEDVLGVGVLRDGASAVVRVKVGGMIGVHSRKWKSEVADAIGEAHVAAAAAAVGTGDTTAVKRNRRPRGK